jgi:hypothetical protein
MGFGFGLLCSFPLMLGRDHPAVWMLSIGEYLLFVVLFSRLRDQDRRIACLEEVLSHQGEAPNEQGESSARLVT